MLKKNPARAVERFRRWVDGLPDQTCFHAHKAPGWGPAAVAAVLDEMDADPAHPVERIVASVDRHGESTTFDEDIYCKRWHEATPKTDRMTIVEQRNVLAYMAGPGFGEASAGAVHRIGWSTQMAVHVEFACLGEPRVTPWKWATFVQRANQRRAKLTWAEVTLIEALIDWEWAEVHWNEAVQIVASGTYLARLAGGASVDREYFKWAADGETDQPAGFHERVAALYEAMPDFDSQEQAVARHQHKLANLVNA